MLPALALGGVSNGLAHSVPTTPTRWTEGTGVPAASLPTTLRHVIIVMEENHDLSWTLTDPTFHSLYSQNAHATRAFALCHPSAPNYIAATSATVHQCGSDGVSYYPAANLASDLSKHSLSWQGLFESMPSACDRSDAYPYIAHHNPWVYYSDLRSTCAAHDLSFFNASGASRLQQELNGGTLPSLTFIAPNMLHDAHDGTLAAASSWLVKNVLHPVHASTTYSATTAVIIVFDEAYKKSCACAENGGYTHGGVTVSGGPVYLVVKSPLSLSSDAVTTNITDFNIVSTVEWLLGIPSLGHHDGSKFPALRALFT
jgi:phospholipase C